MARSRSPVVSDTSDDEDELTPTPGEKPFLQRVAAKEVRVVEEKNLFRPVQPGEEETTFVLEDVIIFHPNTSRIANFLSIEFDDPPILTAYGRLSLEPDDFQHLKKTAHKLALECYVQIQVTTFSIGELCGEQIDDKGRYSVWAYGIGRWFEVIPQPEYLEMYHHMIEATTIYYAVTDLYDDEEGNPKATVAEALSRCGQRRGGSGGIRNTIGVVKSHSKFLLGQMMKDDQKSQWKPRQFFRWLAAECPEQYKFLLSKANLVSHMLPPFDLQVPQLPPWPFAPEAMDYNRSDDDEEDEVMSDEEVAIVGKRNSTTAAPRPLPRTKGNMSPPPRRRERAGDPKSPSASTSTSQRIIGLSDLAGESPGETLAKLAIAGSKQCQTLDFNIKKLFDWVNRGYSIRCKFGNKANKGGISDHLFGAEIIRAHSAAILQHLVRRDPAWRYRPLGQGLLAIAKEDPFTGLATKGQRKRRREIINDAKTTVLKVRKTPQLPNSFGVSRNSPGPAAATPPGGMNRPRKVIVQEDGVREASAAREASVNSNNSNRRVPDATRPFYGRLSGKAASLRVPGHPRKASIDDSLSYETDASRKWHYDIELGSDDEVDEMVPAKVKLPIRAPLLGVKVEVLDIEKEEEEKKQMTAEQKVELEGEKRRMMQLVRREAELTRADASHLEEFLQRLKKGPIIRSPLF
ncbi:hypothetical protein BJ878DRAFT_13822 [Calycina marina]|uniref:Uncharacterized protein n=1 Tax=Calycina marina TaxID=1763456 RepID=A0A9P7Z540_9HELO|nr:hypothetical protein BJ878DRAFT_13822 [Calycina marina]